MRCTNHRHRSRYCDHHYHHQNQVYFVLIDVFFKRTLVPLASYAWNRPFCLRLYLYTSFFFSLNLMIWGHCRINSKRLLCLSTPVKLYIPVKLKNRLWYIRILDGMFIISKVKRVYFKFYFGSGRLLPSPSNVLFLWVVPFCSHSAIDFLPLPPFPLMYWISPVIRSLSFKPPDLLQ